MTKRAKTSSGGKSRDEVEADSRPAMRLPSLKLCIANSREMSSYSKTLSGREKVGKLRRELYLLNLLSRMLRLGIRNKMQVLALSRLKVGPTLLNALGEEPNEGPVSWLAQSKLARLSKEVSGKVSLSNDLFNVLDTFFVASSEVCGGLERGTGSGEVDWPNLDEFLDSSLDLSDSETREHLNKKVNKMLNNLKEKKLCNGADATQFDRFFLSFLLLNRFDFISPLFMNSLLSNFYF